MERKSELTVVTENLPATTDQKKEFKGYSMEELRYQRAMLLLRKEFCKSKMIHDLNNIKEHSILGGKKGDSKIMRVGSLTSKLLSGLNYLDYAMLGASIFGTGKKIYNFFKRTKH